jgi:adenylate cyclase
MTAATCGACGAELLANARFCHGCGSPVAESETPAEYKQVTVLFADVVHSMDIATAVGPERLREIMAELVNRSAVVVRRFGGTVDKFTGDGIMAVFGAPAALEDHALRACLAALGVQEEAKQLAVGVADRDSIELLVRVGLNSGQVIAGEIGSGPFGYTAVGDQVGMAQRMESVAPPGGVMLSESTARLVGSAAALGERQLLRIKGASEPVPAHLLLAVGTQASQIGRSETRLVGRQWELNAVATVLDRAVGGRGCVVGVAGPAGIGKSRLIEEATAIARQRGVEVFGTFCESHTTDVPFHVVARLMREATGIVDLEDKAARALVGQRFADAGDEDLLLLYDLMGIRDPDTATPNIDPDARRRRLTALINSLSLSSLTPALYVIEDVHWIDSVSESMLVDLMSVIPQTHSVMVLAYRPEYRGPLAYLAGAQTISLPPLSDAEAGVLLAELLGTDPSVAAIADLIAQRAAGNPFFAQEMVHELADRDVLEGERGQYISRTNVAEISIPATLQAAIAARIDRLAPGAKRTINAAAVIGSRFTTDLLIELGVDPVLDDLVRAELIDQVRFTPYSEYAFRHPVIRSVAYESQLKSARTQLHRRLASTIESRDPASADENASLIAQHSEAAGNLRDAYGWHMRAGAWSSYRDIDAARLSWRRALQVADALPADVTDRPAMRIAPRTMLCGSTWRGTPEPATDLFDELRELCSEAGDKASLAIAMTGLVSEYWRRGRIQMAQEFASEQIALVESLGERALIVAAFLAVAIKAHDGETGDLLRWSEVIIYGASGEPAQGGVVTGSPLAMALGLRGFARWWHGRPGWRGDFEDGLAIARTADPATLGFVTAWRYGLSILDGAFRADDAALSNIENALHVAEASGDNQVLATANYVLGTALSFRQSATDRRRGRELLVQAREMCLQNQFPRSELPMIGAYLAYDKARDGDYEDALPLMRTSVDQISIQRHSVYLVGATGLLVEVLLSRAAEDDVAEADAAVERLAAIPGDEWVARDIMVLRLRTMLAKARGDDAGYRELRDRYRAQATTLGFEGHIQWAASMPDWISHPAPRQRS